jgi:uncharacterized protein YfaS (alpha-2-macroglobulin family)
MDKGYQEQNIPNSSHRHNCGADDILRCSIQITSRREVPMNMVMVDLGIPPGFRVDPSAFKQLLASKALARYELTENQCILYVRSLVREEPLSFTYKLKAQYPIRAQIPSSSVYEYYQPENRDQTEPQKILIE